MNDTASDWTGTPPELIPGFKAMARHLLSGRTRSRPKSYANSAESSHECWFRWPDLFARSASREKKVSK